MSEEPHSTGGRSAQQDLVTGVSDVVNAALGVGASLAKAIAQATAVGQPVSAPAEGSGALNAIVHYGIAAVAGVAGLVIRNAGAVRMGLRPTVEPGHASSPATSMPRVHQGATLRMPLLIENPGEQPMRDVSFRCVEIAYLGAESGRTLDTGNVRVQSVILEILPHDFEKLTLFIDTHPDTAVGRYRAEFSMGAGGGATKVEFDVIAADA